MKAQNWGACQMVLSPRRENNGLSPSAFHRENMMHYFTYILCDHPFGYLYVGVTNDLERRMYQHKTRSFAGYTRSHSIQRLVYFEIHDEIEHAINREKSIKRWKRQWKFNLIEQDNPNWDDLSESLR